MQTATSTYHPALFRCVWTCHLELASCIIPRFAICRDMDTITSQNENVTVPSGLCAKFDSALVNAYGVRMHVTILQTEVN